MAAPLTGAVSTGRAAVPTTSALPTSAGPNSRPAARVKAVRGNGKTVTTMWVARNASGNHGPTEVAQSRSWTAVGSGTHTATATRITAATPAMMIRLRGTWGTVQPVLRRVATIDRALYPSMVVRLPADMGAAGTIIRDSYVRELAGFNVELVPDRGDKFDRVRPLAAQVQHGHVYLQTTSHPTRELAAELHAAGVEVSTAYQWLEGFLSELEKADPRFPKRGYLDQMDAFNGGFELLASDRLTELPAASAVTGARAAAARVWGSATGAAPGSSGGFGGGGLTLLRGGRAAAARRIA